MDYRKTLNLPKTDFPMRARLPEKEPSIVEKWKEVYSYASNELKNRPKYTLHDGPPYANGKIHIGHALNKILKDIVVKYKTLRGFSASFIPGWDCHGLPVEQKLLEELKVKKDEVNQKEFRKKARDFALKYVEIQKKDFVRLGVWGNWESPYLTLNPGYEAGVLKVLASLTEKGYIYRGLRPVNWCIECATALAEAEVEYKDKVSDSVYIRFRLKERPFEGVSGDVDVIVWTTTPWTLISNTAVALHPDLDYVLAETSQGRVIFAESLQEKLSEKFLENVKPVKRFKGEFLEGKTCRHPFLDRDSKIILADYVSSEDGSGCVHIAPGHGAEDFLAGKKYGLEVLMPVDNKGFFFDAGEYTGMNVKEINKVLIDKMRGLDMLLLNEKITHSYPHCWRCKQPLIFRTTEQWFLNVDHKGLRKRLIDNIDKVEWIPLQGKERISAMVNLRPDWCLSRQRLWGVPIPAVKCRKCGAVYLIPEVVSSLAEKVKGQGSDVWFNRDVKEFLPESFLCECGSGKFDKEKDILDVWFESGSSFYSVVKADPSLEFPADLYLEGSDQHRGWFQVSLIPSSALFDTPPFKKVLTHGFVVDGEGRKMSKSQGNVIAPQDIVQKYGADILRLWVSFSDYSEDISLSDTIVRQLVDSYRKIRNTIRFISGNLYDFDFERDKVDYSGLLELDRMVLSLSSGVLNKVKEHYDKFLFYRVYQSVYDFCNITLSSFYLDILKDRLYTFSPKSKERRSAQTVLWYMLNLLIKSIAPVLSFTAEEAYFYFKPRGESNSLYSVFLSEWPDYSSFRDEELEKRWENIFELRDNVLKALEEKRGEGVIGSSLEAKVEIGVPERLFNLYRPYNEVLKEVFIVSEVLLSKSEKLSINIKKASGEKCPRCWNYFQDTAKEGEFKGLCGRCAESLKDIL